MKNCVSAHVILHTYYVQANGSDSYITLPGIHPTAEMEYYRYQVSINDRCSHNILVTVIGQPTNNILFLR